MFIKPWFLQSFIICSNIGLFAIFNIGLGVDVVNGLNLVPYPPAIINT